MIRFADNLKPDPILYDAIGVGQRLYPFTLLNLLGSHTGLYRRQYSWGGDWRGFSSLAREGIACNRCKQNHSADQRVQTCGFAEK